MRHARYYAPNGVEITARKLIWADRIAIAFWALTGGLIGLVYAGWGDPGAFKTFEQIAGVATFGLWFIARVLDFAVTGRVR